ncbi:MAG: peptidase M1 [Acidobacteriia bacterium]|nr:peptidase M1 [Terriglobia bacterium]
MAARKPIWALIAFISLIPSAAHLGAQQDRRTRLDVQDVTIDADINPRTQSLSATAVVRFIPLDDNAYSATFELNNALQVSRVVDATGRQIPAVRSQQDFSVRLTFPESLKKGEVATAIFTYDGRLTGLEESPIYGIKFASIQEDFAYLMYPARWFPVNEYTADRYSAKFKIGVPDGYKVLCSGLETKASVSGKTVYEFDYSRQAFPGSVAVVRGEPQMSRSQGITTTLYLRGESQGMAAAYGEEIARQMAFFTSLYGLPPQADLTVMETDAGTPNGYSAPGMIFLSTRAIGKKVDTRLLSNQISRQWWGTLVSPVSRNHIWITNSAARYSELFWLEQNSGPAAVEAEMKDIFVEALTVAEPPVIQSARLEDYSPEFWAVTSAKGTAVLGMLRFIIGDEAFQKTLKSLLTTGAWKSLSTDDVRKAAETASGKNLQGFFIQWIESTGAPEFKLEYTVFRTSKGFRIMGKINQDLDTFRMPVDLQIETEGNPETKQVEVVGTASEFFVESFGRPKKVVLDPAHRVLRYSNPVRVAVAIRRGEMFAEISEFGDALKEYQKALDVNRNSSLAHYRVAELFFLQRNYQAAANEFREALSGDLEPKWTEVWTHINLAKIFDITGQRERAVNEYNQAIRTKDNTQGAQEEAAKYLMTPYERPATTQ